MLSKSIRVVLPLKGDKTVIVVMDFVNSFAKCLCYYLSMKFIRCFLLALTFALLSATHAQDGCPPEPTLPAPAELAALQKSAKDRGFLWRVTKDGRASYLYGTIHVSKLEWAFPGPQLVKAVLQTDAVAFELNPTDPDTLRVLGQGMQDTSAQPLPAALQARVARQAQAICVPEANIKTLRPEFQLVTLSVFAMKKQGIHPGYGADAVIAGMANSSKRTIEALETAADQVKALQAGSRADALAMLDEGLAQLENGTAQTLLAKLAQAWADSDYNTISSYATWCNCMNTDKERAEMRRMLDDRNVLMAQRIDALHTQGLTIFTAVGTLHMIGPTGLPALMQQRGYVVEKVF